MGNLTKPKSCDVCPAVERDKQLIRCGCLRTLSAGINNNDQKINMWNKCPLGWENK